MTLRFVPAFVSICTLIGVMSMANRGFAESGEMSEPRLAMGKEFSETDKKQLREVLERKGCKFLGGNWLNAHTSLRYAGDTTALNLFIEALSQCPNVTVHVNFFRPSPGGVECDWMLTQLSPSNKLVVRVNLASENIKMENLYLPPVKGEKVLE